MPTVEELRTIADNAFLTYRAAQDAAVAATSEYEAFCAQIGEKERALRTARDTARDARIAWDNAMTAWNTALAGESEPPPEVEDDPH